MTKFTACIIGAASVVAVATVVIFKYQTQLGQLNEDSLRRQSDQVSTLPAENIRPSNVIERTSGSETRTNEPPSRELLRLRGEVARLRHEQNEAETLRQEKEETINKLRRQIQQLSDQSSGEMSGAAEVDKDGLPELRFSGTTNEVLAELQRVDAKLLAYQDKFGQQYIHANIFPKEALTTNANVAVSMEFYFEDGKLSSRRLQRTSQP